LQLKMTMIRSGLGALATPPQRAAGGGPSVGMREASMRTAEERWQQQPLRVESVGRRGQPTWWPRIRHRRQPPWTRPALATRVTVPIARCFCWPALPIHRCRWGIETAAAQQSPMASRSAASGHRQQRCELVRVGPAATAVRAAAVSTLKSSCVWAALAVAVARACGTPAVGPLSSLLQLAHLQRWHRGRAALQGAAGTLRSPTLRPGCGWLHARPAARVAWSSCPCDRYNAGHLWQGVVVLRAARRLWTVFVTGHLQVGQTLTTSVR
jgi:hypothetical protein